MRAVHLLGAALSLAVLTNAAGAQTTSAAPAAPAASATPARPAPAKLPADSLELARKYARWFYTAQTDSLVAHSALGNQTVDQMKAQITGSLGELTSRAGTEVEVLEEKFVTRNGRRQYWRTAKFSDFGEPLLIRFVLDEKGLINGFGLGPKSQAPPIDPQ